jgi:DNA polymerase III delta prime subunit
MFPKDTLHHAYFIQGDKTLVLHDLEVFLKDSFDIIREGHPDVHYSEYESFGIDEGRSLQEMQSFRPLVGDKKIFIITLNSITSEAQNSLLKVFEEPTEGAHFFIISSSSRILLPTLRSRMVVITHESSTTEVDNSEVKKFIKLSVKDRLEYVSSLIEEKDKARIEAFLQALVGELASHINKTKGNDIKEILTLITYLKDRAPSLKLILERVALLQLR